MLGIKRVGNGSSDPRNLEVDSNNNREASPRQFLRLANFTFISPLNFENILIRGGADAPWSTASSAAWAPAPASTSTTRRRSARRPTRRRPIRPRAWRRRPGPAGVQLDDAGMRQRLSRQ
jgi:hypothetical protein